MPDRVFDVLRLPGAVRAPAVVIAVLLARVVQDIAKRYRDQPREETIKRDSEASDLA